MFLPIGPVFAGLLPCYFILECDKSFNFSMVVVCCDLTCRWVSVEHCFRPTQDLPEFKGMDSSKAL